MVEDPGHVKEYGQHHEVGRPSVHVAHQQTETDRGLQGLDIGPCHGGSRPVEEHQEDAGDGQVNKQEETQATQAKGVTDLHCVPFHLHGVEVVEDAIHDHVGPVTGAVVVALSEDRPGAEDGAPGLGTLDLVGQLAQLFL